MVFLKKKTTNNVSFSTKKEVIKRIFLHKLIYCVRVFVQD